MNREPRHPPAPAHRPRARMLRLRRLGPAVLACAVIGWTPTAAAAQPPPGPSTDVAKPDTAQVTDTLAALDRLHHYGYTINTPTRATRAIRHWQTANGIPADGIVGPETLSSLRLPSQTSTPAPAPATLPPASPATDDVETIIRDAWPDDLEDRALSIAYRESRLKPGARNACCLGLFQIHWAAHRAWLAELGITSAAQLLDAGTNAAAAYALYQRDGWHPWAL